MLRRFMFSGVMMSAVVIPYAMSTGGEWYTAAKNRVASMTQSSPKESSAPNAEGAALAAYGSTETGQQGHSLAAAHLPRANQVPVEGYGTLHLGEVINFNATPSWVMARWPRVTVGLAETELQGYRVALVSGTAQDDIAGSLTYYFDNEQRVSIIHFRGSTGDPRKLVALVMSQYEMLPQATGDPRLQLYQRKWNGKPVSELQIHTADVLRANEPYSRFSLELAIKRS